MFQVKPRYCQVMHKGIPADGGDEAQYDNANAKEKEWIEQRPVK